MRYSNRMMVALSLVLIIMIRIPNVHSEVVKDVYVQGTKWTAYDVPASGADLKLNVNKGSAPPILSSQVRVEDTSDTTAWTSVSKTSDLHVYRILGVKPGHEWVAIAGECGATGGGSGAGGSANIPFEVGVIQVESVDVVNPAPYEPWTLKRTVANADHFVAPKGRDVMLIAKINPDTPEARSALIWEADGAALTSPALDNNKLTAKLTSNAPNAVPVRIKISGCGSSSWTGTVWFAWGTLSGKNTTLSGGDNAALLVNGNWPATLGGGDALGPISVESNPQFLYGPYAACKVEFEAVIAPAGVVNIFPDIWRLGRDVTQDIEWENAGSYRTGQWVNDPSAQFPPPNSPPHLVDPDWSDPPALDEDPTSGTSTHEIYDIDVPGIPKPRTDPENAHTTERYMNFREWMQLQFNGGAVSGPRCSDFVMWSYVGQIDMDKNGSKIDKNELKFQHVTMPVQPFYGHR